MRVPNQLLSVGVFALVAGLAAGATIATRDRWLPLLTAKPPAFTTEAGHDDHVGHDHGAEGEGSDQNSVPLSDQARTNLGLKLGPVEFSDYTKNLLIPGVVVEQPGHSERRITTSLAGVVVKVHAFPGQAVKPGDPLLDIQPTGELLTNAQAELLKSLQDIELVDLELKRLAPLVENGSIPARNKLEKEYERKRLDSQKLVQIQELLVRGLTPYQITEMVEHKTLLREFTIRVPGGPPKPPPKDDVHNHPSIVPTGLTPAPERLESIAADTVYTVEKIDIFPGKLVEPGDELCDLGLHTELYLEGHAFERDGRLVALAVQQQRLLTALFEGESEAPDLREGLQIRYVENSLDAATRTLRFFVPLKNEVVRDAEADNGVIYRSWRFKPGQKVRLLLPVQKLTDQIVLPAEAVVSEGPDVYVFRANGELLERVPVVIEHRDPRNVVIRNDGNVFLGDEIAMNQAYQINLALKKQQGSGIDPHAGHNH
ncbi:MAG TPA: efflux RND transporter periplasmic adaptor subunit [Planctomycetaceae bacterium]|nr:efflux RND transporter periplasmic adaptor subunit [Planctomycetaceae bacterium]